MKGIFRNNTVSYNTVTNHEYGVLLIGFSNSNVIGNHISGGGYGLFAGYCSGSMIADNEITSKCCYAPAPFLISPHTLTKDEHGSYDENLPEKCGFSDKFPKC